MTKDTLLTTADAQDINLTMLNALVKELNDLLIAVDANKTITKEVRVVEYSKTYGLCANISAEAMALMSDISKVIGAATATPTHSDPSTGLLSGIFGGKPDKRN